MDPRSYPYGWRDEVIEGAARRVLETGLGSGKSAIDAAEGVWTGEIAAGLHRIIDRADWGTGKDFRQKMNGLLEEAPREVRLLCADLLFLQVAPLARISLENKRKRILESAGLSTDLPVDLDDALDRHGVFVGGPGFTTQIHRQLGWLLSFVSLWREHAEEERHAALHDPWEFRKIAAALPKNQHSIRNSLLYLAFPDVFPPIVSQEDKKAIRNAFAHLIGGPTGKDPVSIDRDLFAIQARHAGETEGQVNYYVDPYQSPWQKPEKERGHT